MKKENIFHTSCHVHNKVYSVIFDCSDPRARLDPVGRSEPKARGCPAEAINQIPLVIVLLNFRFQKCCDPKPRLDPVGGSKLEPGLLRLFNYLLKTFCLCYSISDFLITRKHFVMGKPTNIYKFKRPIKFTFIKMHLQNRSSEFKLFYKISMFERNGVNAYDGAYSAILPL